MRLRYRHLIKGALIRPAYRQFWGVRELGGTRDGEGTVEEIVGLLRGGQLLPRDLVWIDGGWEWIADSEQFSSVCAPLLRREGITRAIEAAVPYLFLVAAVGVTEAGPAQHWLAHSSLLSAAVLVPIFVIFSFLHVWALNRR
ncbi:MAG TPA: hypothetical protein VMB50_10415 [Myxococcales bacterium]|nr:hypothetical protein [Myxococcales bacterium]